MKQTPEIISLQECRNRVQENKPIGKLNIACPRCHGGMMIKEEVTRITGADRPEIRLRCDNCGIRETV